MWLLVLVFVYAAPGWPADQPRPTREVVIEFETLAECEHERDRWVAEQDAQPSGWDERWAPLLQGCEAQVSTEELIA